MNQIAAIGDPRDIAYVRRHFAVLQDLCAAHGRDAVAVAAHMDAGRIPAAAYVLNGGERYVPPDYFDCIFSKDDFIERFMRESGRLGVAASREAASEEWLGHLSGVYFVCLIHATPENIARKGALLARIDALIAHPQDDSDVWRHVLQEAVNQLDALERPFSPVYDRTRFGRRPTRDTYITDVRHRFRL